MRGFASVLSAFFCAVSFAQVSGPGLSGRPDGNNQRFLTATVSGPSQVVKNAFFIITVVGRDSDTHPSLQARDFNEDELRVGGVAARIWDTAGALAYHFDEHAIVQRTVIVGG